MSSFGSKALPAETAEEHERNQRAKRAGCIACYLDGRNACGAVETHHVKLGNRQVGHRFTIELGAWHHQGIKPSALSAVVVEQLFGPSLARNPRAFHERYGSDQALLDAQDRRLGYPLARIERARSVVGSGKRTARTGHRNGESTRSPSSKIFRHPARGP